MEQTLEIFCGETKAFSSIAGSLGFGTFTVDANPAVFPDLAGDVCTLSASSLPASPFIVWAAPPAFSVFRERSAWATDGSYSPETDEGESAMEIIRRTIDLITALKPTWWFLENPRSLLRDMPIFAGFNRGYPTRNRLTFRSDEWGGSSDAETDVWTNAFWWLPRPGERAPEGGVDTGRRVPPFAIASMFEQLEQYRSTGIYGPR